jgi:hypothetical protein
VEACGGAPSGEGDGQSKAGGDGRVEEVEGRGSGCELGQALIFAALLCYPDAERPRARDGRRETSFISGQQLFALDLVARSFRWLRQTAESFVNLLCIPEARSSFTHAPPDDPPLLHQTSLSRLATRTEQSVRQLIDDDGAN